MNGKELVERWFQQVWLAQDWAAIDRLFAPDAQARGVMSFEMMPADFEALVPAILSHVEEPVIEIPRVVEQGDWVSAFVVLHARAVRGGHPVDVSGQIMARIENGRFVEVYNTFDSLGFCCQLGFLPEDALPLCLAGEQIGA